MKFPFQRYVTCLCSEEKLKSENDDVIVFVLFLTLSTFSGSVVSKKVVQLEISFPTVYNMPMFEELEIFSFSDFCKNPPF